MKFNRLHINHFGKLQNLTLEFSDGINVLYGSNESGKSTLHAFLEAMLFGVERSRGKAAHHDAYTRYFPTGGGSSTYGGVLEFTQNGTLYSIYRNFRKDPRKYTLMDETHNRQLNLTEEEYQKLLSNLTLPLYRNTVSLPQLQTSVSDSLPEQLNNHIINLHAAGSASIDVSQAKERLQKDRRQLELSYSREAEKEAKELDARIEHLQAELDAMPAHPDYHEMEQESDDLDEEIARMNSRHEELAQTIGEDENYLKDHSGGDLDALPKIRQELEPLTKSRNRYLENHRGALALPLRILSILGALLFLIGGISGIALGTWYYRRGGETFLVIALIACSLVALLLFLFMVIVLSSDRRFRRNNQRILELVQKVENDDTPRRVTDEALDEFTGILDNLNQRSQSLAKNREEDRSVTEDLLRSQTQSGQFRASLENVRHEMWQREQHEEALRDLMEERDSLAETLEQNQRLSEEISAVDLAIETIDHLSETAFDSFGQYLQETASQLLSQITGGRYSRLLMDDDLNITLEQDHVPVSLEGLSCSTLDQVYLSLRIACIRFFWPTGSMPLLLDESFAMYDTDRIAETLTWLSRYYPGQILIFTCQHREEEILTNCGIKYQTISL